MIEKEALEHDGFRIRKIHRQKLSQEAKKRKVKKSVIVREILDHWYDLKPTKGLKEPK